MTRPLVWLPAHGGSGVTTVRRTLGLGQEVSSLRAAPSDAVVVIVCRDDVRGLTRAQQLAALHASGSDGQLLAGLVVVASAPGKVPKPLADLTRLVTGGFSDWWYLPWSEPTRLGQPPDLDHAPKVIRALREQLMFVCNERATRSAPAGAPSLWQLATANSNNHN